MPGIGNNLYPPIVKTWMPAFVRTNPQGCRVYFSISSYNSLSEINQDAVQVIVNHQKSNASVLNSDLYPSGIKITTLHIDDLITSDDKYYIEILPSDLEGGQFTLNAYYKVQLRFTLTAITAPSDSTKIDGWLSNNISAFSQWSTVCLIYSISNPIVYLNNFDDTSLTTITLTNLQVVGTVDFFEKDDTETVKSYKVYIYDDEDLNRLLWQSQTFYTNKYNNPNEINQSLKYQFNDNQTYYMILQITTSNLYIFTKRYDFNVIAETGQGLSAAITATPDPDSGSIQIKINGSSAFAGNITIRRSSYKTSFKIWEDIKTVFISSALDNLNYSWFDRTVQSGVWYKYCVQKRDTRGRRSISIETRNPTMVVFQDMFLLADGKQLNIRFDPKVDSYSHNIIEGKIDTIGSKYPFIRRNNNIDYKTFSISGTITAFMDKRNNLMSSSKSDIYGEYKDLYDSFNLNNNITDFNNYTYERDFRKTVIDFLYKNNVKLFKSPTQGNILVKLMNINFTPNQTLSRMIYSFSCNAYEIDESTISNFDKYQIQSIGNIETNTDILYTIQGQIVKPQQDKSYSKSNTFPTSSSSGSNIITSLINPKYQKFAIENFVSNVEYLSYLKIEFTTNPYLIEIYNNQPRKYTGSTTGSGALILGHIIYINNKPIIVNKDGIYELKGEDVKITKLTFDQSQQGYIDYIANITIEEDLSSVPLFSSIKDKIGQLYGFFDVNDDLYTKIANRYNQVVTLENEQENYFKRSFLSLNGLRFTAKPNTVIYIKEKQDSDLQRHVIGESEILQFYDTDTSIDTFYFSGVHFYPAENSSIIRDGQYYETGIVLNSLTDVQNPISGGVYTLAEQAVNASYTQESKRSASGNTYKQFTLSMRQVNDIEVGQDSIYETAKHNNSSIPKIHDTLIIDEESLIQSKHNIRSIANALVLSSTSAGIKILGIYDNDLTDDIPERGITISSGPIHGDSKKTLQFNENFSDVINNLTVNISVNDLYRAILERVILESQKYIFYDGGWYPITDNYDIIYPVTAIIDYYCKYQEGRY